MQLADAIRRQEHPGADLAEARGLLIDRNPEAVSDQRVRREQSANTTSDDDNIGPRLRHHLILEAIPAINFQSAGFRTDAREKSSDAC